MFNLKLISAKFLLPMISRNELSLTLFTICIVLQNWQDKTPKASQKAIYHGILNRTSSTLKKQLNQINMPR